MDGNLFSKAKLFRPEASFGRYLVANPDDAEVIDKAYNYLIDTYKEGELISNLNLRTFIDRMTSGTAMDHLFILKMNKTNPAFVYKMLEIIISIMKELSEYDFSFETKTKVKNPNESCYLMRYCVEMLISYLYVRKEFLYEDLRPGKRLSSEIIYYLKKFNKNFQLAKEKWPSEEKQPKMETKYRMTSKDKPEELYKVWDDAYCLILYLSGAKEANNIILGSEEDYE